MVKSGNSVNLKIDINVGTLTVLECITDVKVENKRILKFKWYSKRGMAMIMPITIHTCTQEYRI